MKQTTLCTYINDNNLISGVKNFTLNFPKTKVPSDATTYMCMMFEIPIEESGDLHVIGTMSNIDNANIMHHIIVRTCSVSICEFDSQAI